MKHYLLSLYALFLLFGCGSSPGDAVVELDEAMKFKDTYEIHFRERQDLLKKQKEEEDDPVRLYRINADIAENYSAYSLDSTLTYLSMNIAIAEATHDRVRKIAPVLGMIHEYTQAGYYVEAQELALSLRGMDVPQELKQDYFSALHDLAGELMYYANDRVLHADKLRERNEYRDSLLSLVEEGSMEWYNLKREEAQSANDTLMFMEYARKALELASPYSRDYAKAAYFYAESFPRSRDQEKMDWLARSAIADIICATKDYASLNLLSQMLFRQGDIDRAFRYAADHCMIDALFYGGKLRPWQISQFFPQIEKAYDAKLKGQHLLLSLTLVAMAVMLAVLIAFLFFTLRQRHKLARTNAELGQLNSKLVESDEVKQQYIMQFLGLLSEHINANRQYKNHVLKYLRRGNEKYLIDEIEELPSIDKDIQEFNKMFDEVFLNLYPDFVSQFNSLLADDARIVPKEPDLLTPDLRIFALIKLGVTDSGKIASLLHFSANTVYNYRAKVKNKTKVPREKFEEAVRNIK